MLHAPEDKGAVSIDTGFFLPLIDAALAEDVGSGDVTTLGTVSKRARAEGVMIAGQSGVICGLPVARAVFLRVDSGMAFESDVVEGDHVRPGQRIARVFGSARSILTAERAALNFLQHLSGIATATARAVAQLEGTSVRLLDTRKTIPGYRHLAKYAVRVGGGENHRMGLYDMVLIKENHIESAGGVGTAIRKARKGSPTLPLEVEVKSLSELLEALDEEPDRVLLDNFDPVGVKKAIKRIRGWGHHTGKHIPLVELSGGVTPETVGDYAVDGVDFISSGAITHSAPALDVSLDLKLIEAGHPEGSTGNGES